MNNIHIVDVDQSNAQQILIDESRQRPVLIDFWADWCEPCKQLMPTLEKLVTEYAGQFLLARVNADTEQMIAGQFGIRSLPTVILMKDGQPVDGFTGLQAEQAIRELLDKHLPKPWDEQAARAQQLMADGDYAGATELLRDAHRDSGERSDITLLLADALVEQNRCDEATTLLATIRLADQDHYFEQVMAKLELKQEAASSPEIQALEAKLAEAPEDQSLRFQLAVQYSQADRYREALELLMNILQQDREYDNGGARKALLDIIKTLGNKDPLAIEFQRKLYSLLY